MNTRKTRFRRVRLSLYDLVGREFIEAACGARAGLTGEDKKHLKALAAEKIDFYPAEQYRRLVEWLPRVGEVCCRPVPLSVPGATSLEFQAHSKPAIAPLTCLGFYRISEDGRLFLISKSEHYHVALGHHFPGFQLVERARRLGISNATHNVTRGQITRTLEQELVRVAAGGEPHRGPELLPEAGSRQGALLDRVLNLETGSLAMEAAIKMILARFYRSLPESPRPKYHGRIPVLVVLGDHEGNLQANYHGTTMVAQMMRGMWPEMLAGLEKMDLLRVRGVRPNDERELESVLAAGNHGQYKVAGFFHEFIMMNYGASRLTDSYIRRAYALCRKYDIPTVADEIQTCVWSPEIFMFREYGVRPSIVVVGKGFPGGEYPASRILFNRTLDTLPLFGALVTNGQEELASLSYLVTLRWAEANAEVTRAIGDYYEARLRELAERHPGPIASIEGRRHLAGIYFHDLGTGKRFARILNDGGLDISVQTYKEGCPPCALTKLPLTAGYEVVDMVITRFEAALRQIDPSAPLTSPRNGRTGRPAVSPRPVPKPAKANRS